MSVEPTRRQILGAAVASLALPVLLQTTHSAHAADEVKPDADGWIDTGIQPDAIKDNSLVFVKGAAIVLASSGKKIFALTTICTHKKCSVKANRKKPGSFVCPCHDAEYDISGAVVKGPATKPLSHHAIRLTDKTIRVNLTKEVGDTDKEAAIPL